MELYYESWSRILKLAEVVTIHHAQVVTIIIRKLFEHTRIILNHSNFCY